jgi:hypothetical protein
MQTKIPWWVSVIVMIGVALMAAGGVIALVNPRMLVSPSADVNDAVRVYAGYFVSRNLVLAVMLLAALAWRARPVLNALLVVVGLIQFADALIDAVEGRWPILPGVLVLGCMFVLAASHVSGAAFWRREAWSPSA